MAQGVTDLPPTFFVVRAHAARERDDRDGARRALAEALNRDAWALGMTRLAERARAWQ